MIESKNSIVRRLVRSGEYKKALQICKDWRYSNPEYRSILSRGYECLVHPEFYRQLGKDPTQEYELAVSILEEVYGLGNEREDS